MLFHEIYGRYYQTVADILTEAAEGTLTGKCLTAIVEEKAFGESLLTIPDKLKSQQWPLLYEDYSTPLSASPSMPLTTLEKQWMKALLLDPRIRLFSPSAEGLEDVQPLFTQEMLCYYDRNADGDDFSNPQYIENFRTVLTALREKKCLQVTYQSAKRNLLNVKLSPCHLEYSPKDDKFRLLGQSYRALTVNLSQILSCEMLNEERYLSDQPLRRIKTLTLELTDERNTLERLLLHFSHLKRETKRLDETHYRVTLEYDDKDETEMLIRVLSFGPTVKVTAPESFVERIRQRLTMQKQR